MAPGEEPEEDDGRGLEEAAAFVAVKTPPGSLVRWEERCPPALDPFTADERRLAPGVHREAPFDE